MSCLDGDVSEFAMVEGRNIVAGNVKEIGNRVMDGDSHQVAIPAWRHIIDGEGKLSR
jgi:hypothetical protein